MGERKWHHLMTEIVEINVSVGTLVDQTVCPVAEPYWAFDKIQKGFAQFVNPATGIFFYQGARNGNLTRGVVEFLESIGVILIWDRYPYTPKSLGRQVDGKREFDSEDYDSATHFVMRPSELIAEAIGDPTSDGVLTFRTKSMNPGKRIGLARFGGAYCLRELKLELEKMNFPGMRFRETKCGGDDGAIWEMRSSVVLPPVLNEGFAMCLPPYRAFIEEVLLESREYQIIPTILVSASIRLLRLFAGRITPDQPGKPPGGTQSSCNFAKNFIEWSQKCQTIPNPSPSHSRPSHNRGRCATVPARRRRSSNPPTVTRCVCAVIRLSLRRW